MTENTPMVIDRYRATTAALGYTGDSVINSLSDILMMALGFLLARKLPVVGRGRCLLIALEVMPLFVIRDNLTLNVWTLLAPEPGACRRGRRAAEGTIARRGVFCLRHFEGDAVLRLLALLCAAARRRAFPARPRPASCSAASTSMTSRCRSTIAGIESGVDLSLGYRGGASAILARRSSPMCSAALNTAGNTNYARGRHFGEVRARRIWYFRPGLGLAIHNGSAGKFYPHRQDRLRQPRAVRARDRPSARRSTAASASRRAGCT